MSYVNTNGTIQSSFSIGSRGIILKSFTDGNKKKFLKVNDKIVVTEDSVFIPKEILTNLNTNEEKTQCTFTYKKYDEGNSRWIEETITVDTSKGGIQAPKETEENTIPVFGDNNGENLKNTNYFFLNKFSESTNKNNEIPTLAVIEELVGAVINPLSKRLSGENAKIIK